MEPEISRSYYLMPFKLNSSFEQKAWIFCISNSPVKPVMHYHSAVLEIEHPKPSMISQEEVHCLQIDGVTEVLLHNARNRDQL